MKITKLKKTKSGKYDLILENNNKITTYDEVILNNNLLFDKEIDDDKLKIINKENDYYKIYNKIIKLISTKLRSELEIKEYLDKNEIDEKQQEKIINDLKKQGLINDLQFTKAFIMDKINLSNNGPIKIKNELENYGIEESIINEELNKIESEIYIEKINKIINKKLKTSNKYSEYILKQKIKQELISQGFYSDDINECINKINLNNNDALEKNFEQIYKKLKNKYEGNILKQKLKEKLYQKGFNLSDIENIINEKLD